MTPAPSQNKLQLKQNASLRLTCVTTFAPQLGYQNLDDLVITSSIWSSDTQTYNLTVTIVDSANFKFQLYGPPAVMNVIQTGSAYMDIKYATRGGDNLYTETIELYMLRNITP